MKRCEIKVDVKKRVTAAMGGSRRKTGAEAI